MRFEFATAGRIIFGAGTLGEIGRIAREFGPRAFVVTGRRSERAGRLLDLLRATKVDATTFAIANEPTTDDILRGTMLARAANCDVVIGFGGGAALDAAKAISALVTNTGNERPGPGFEWMFCARAMMRGYSGARGSSGM